MDKFIKKKIKKTNLNKSKRFCHIMCYAQKVFGGKLKYQYIEPFKVI